MFASGRHIVVRDRVGMTTEPSCWRRVLKKTQLDKPIKVEIPALQTIATKRIRLVSIGSYNKYFPFCDKGDLVTIIKDYKHFRGEIWAISKRRRTGKCLLRQKCKNELIKTLENFTSKFITGVIRTKGYAGDRRKIKHQIPILKECYCVEFDDFSIPPIWFESAMFLHRVDEWGQKILVLSQKLCASNTKKELWNSLNNRGDSSSESEDEYEKQFDMEEGWFYDIDDDKYDDPDGYFDFDSDEEEDDYGQIKFYDYSSGDDNFVADDKKELGYDLINFDDDDDDDDDLKKK